MSSHLDASGTPRMVDVGQKPPTQRRAVARGYVLIPRSLEGLEGGEWWSPKGPVFQTAVIAGIQGAKQTSTAIPLCHPIPLTSCQVRLEPLDWQTYLAESRHTGFPLTTTDPDEHQVPTVIRVTCTAATTAPTGVEMEALSGVSAACLTVYDMGKSVTKGIVISALSLLEKTGGKEDWRARGYEG
ncbi:cyclic pyranopterin monophosphate synthase [Spirochaeta lutea]|uniref:Molybdopterin cofactor biosynthesis C (MoaC) domain-containing protein n=1 Tax=Spirochaeta lutea TaxID=1480694 RepID=A0A098QUB9_9SPIO|nr:cyclic pyranopterin monophosphate synthase MoaC [Spirochaeta lutea]KGE70993.1 hypothetical protein DC28_13795 [Spirochaeta lutea]